VGTGGGRRSGERAAVVAGDQGRRIARGMERLARPTSNGPPRSEQDRQDHPSQATAGRLGREQRPASRVPGGADRFAQAVDVMVTAMWARRHPRSGRPRRRGGVPSTRPARRRAGGPASAGVLARGPAVAESRSQVRPASGRAARDQIIPRRSGTRAAPAARSPGSEAASPSPWAGSQHVPQPGRHPAGPWREPTPCSSSAASAARAPAVVGRAVAGRSATTASGPGDHRAVSPTPARRPRPRRCPDSAAGGEANPPFATPPPGAPGQRLRQAWVRAAPNPPAAPGTASRPRGRQPLDPRGQRSAPAPPPAAPVHPPGRTPSRPHRPAPR